MVLSDIQVEIASLKDKWLHNGSYKPIEQQIFDFDPDKISLSALKLNICPNMKVIRKYIPFLHRVVSFAVPCGKCLYCKHKKQNGLIYRIYNHSQAYFHKLFVTLTYDNAHLPYNEYNCKVDFQKFLKRLRYYLSKTSAIGFSYFGVCERGALNGRFHFHLLMFWNGDLLEGFMKKLINDSWCFPVRNFQSSDDYSNRDGKSSFAGFTYFGDISNQSITYCTKYCNKDNGTVFLLWSHGLGLVKLEDCTDDTDIISKFRFFPMTTYCTYDENGIKVRTVPVPKYYRDKVRSVLDKCWIFENYLNSPYSKHLLTVCSNDKVMEHYSNLYEQYEKLSVLREAGHVAKRKRKMRLL